MTIEQAGVVDLIALDPKANEVLLVISDHLEWTGDHQANMLHMYLLQEKTNAYVAFIESGDIYQSYPKARGREIVIQIMAAHPLSSEAEAFFQKVKAFLLDAGYAIRFRHMP